MNTTEFVQNVQHFCKLRDIKPTVACTESGAGRNFLTYVKKGQAPSVQKVQLLATYLGVTTSQLLGEEVPEGNKNSPDSISVAEAALNEEIINRICQLTPEELVRVDAFVQGILAAR